MIIRRNTAGTSPPAPPQQQQPQEMMPIVTFQQPGERREAMAMPGHLTGKLASNVGIHLK